MIKFSKRIAAQILMLPQMKHIILIVAAIFASAANANADENPIIKTTVTIEDCIKYNDVLYCHIPDVTSRPSILTKTVPTCIIYQGKIYCRPVNASAAVVPNSDPNYHCIAVPSGEMYCGVKMSLSSTGMTCTTGNDGVAHCGSSIMSFKPNPHIVCITQEGCPSANAEDGEDGTDGKSKLIEALQKFINGG